MNARIIPLGLADAMFSGIVGLDVIARVTNPELTTPASITRKMSFKRLPAIRKAIDRVIAGGDWLEAAKLDSEVHWAFPSDPDLQPSTREDQNQLDS